MAEGVTTTGLEQYDQARRALPDVLAAELRSTAASAAADLHRLASAAARTRGWALADEIVIVHRASEQRYVVEVKPKNPRPANLPLWLEHGTRHMVARPFWRPAVNTVGNAYPQMVERAVQRAADRTVNR